MNQSSKISALLETEDIFVALEELTLPCSFTWRIDESCKSDEIKQLFELNHEFDYHYQ